MKPKKTIKSLAELSADSIGVIDTEREKAKPPEPDVLAQSPPNAPPDSFPRVSDVRGVRDHGINE
jgi:hypothetical protein